MIRTVYSLCFFFLAVVATAQEADTSPRLEFNRDVRPILSENCYYCHGNDPKHRMADLRLDVRDEAIAGAAILPGDPASSLVIDRIHSDDTDQLMPPVESNKSLTDAQKETLRRWIAEGAEYQPHWAFAEPKLADAVDLSDTHPIDYFVQSKLHEHGLRPSPPAELHTLIRRLSLDLTGIPPTPAEVDNFVAAAQQDLEPAYDALIERLLSSPHYGEKWARWWLDQARYADSNGYSVDAPRQIWKYRDWVIQALNNDMPFDQFTIEQLAGDLLPHATTDQKIATGFHRNTQINEEGGIDREQFRIDSVFDRVATTGTVWLGLTVGCAQCHDHKFDPIEQREFYQLFAFFNNQDEPTMKVYPADVDPAQLADERNQVRANLSAFAKDHNEELSEWEKALTVEERQALSKGVRQALETSMDKRSPNQLLAMFEVAIDDSATYGEWLARDKQLDVQLNQVPTTLVMQERASPRETHRFINGDFTRPAEEVTESTPSALHPMEFHVSSEQSHDQRPTRLDLAKWIVSPRNPLTARVIMNRVWQQYFGRGIVETENDFGSQGSLPTHPELLDWLALTWVDHEWSLKSMHRAIVKSNTYRQSSINRPEIKEQDPNNYLLARQQRLRLDAELVRDMALSVSGLLSPKIGGPSVFPPLPDGVMGQGQVKRAWNVSAGEDKFRRGMYTFVYRASPPPTLSVFDAPEGFSTCTRRIRSNTPLQSLTLMNDLSFHEFATELTKVIERDGLELAFKRCTSRMPSHDELEILQKLDTLNAARVLINLDETITRE